MTALSQGKEPIKIGIQNEITSVLKYCADLEDTSKDIGDCLQAQLYQKNKFHRNKANKTPDQTVVELPQHIIQDFLDKINKVNTSSFLCIYFIILEIYVHLNDVDGVTGVAAICFLQPSIKEQILQYESTGNFRDAMVCYQLAIKQQPQQAKYQEDLLQCMMNLGELTLALTNVDGILAENVEAAWKLGDWGCLEQTLREY